MGATNDIAAFAVKTNFEDLPGDVVHEAKREWASVVAGLPVVQEPLRFG